MPLSSVFSLYSGQSILDLVARLIGSPHNLLPSPLSLLCGCFPNLKLADVPCYPFNCSKIAVDASPTVVIEQGEQPTGRGRVLPPLLIRAVLTPQLPME